MILNSSKNPQNGSEYCGTERMVWFLNHVHSEGYYVFVQSQSSRLNGSRLIFTVSYKKSGLAGARILLNLTNKDSDMEQLWCKMNVRPVVFLFMPVHGGFI